MWEAAKQDEEWVRKTQFVRRAMEQGCGQRQASLRALMNGTGHGGQGIAPAVMNGAGQNALFVMAEG